MIVFVVLLLLLVSPSLSDPSLLLGSGNFQNGQTDSTTIAQFQALVSAGAHAARCNLYPGDYYNDGTSTVILSLDAQLLFAYNHSVTPILLFEYYYGYTNPVGPYSKWYNIGRQFATRYGPNGSWGKQYNIPSSYGITMFEAFNEPDGTALNTTQYYYALLGLADGVHSVNKSSRVFPGGFKSPNCCNSYTLEGLGLVLAPLWNNYTLAGIDLHTYFDVQYAPMDGTYRFSMQGSFDLVKSACNITADVEFFASEWNFKRRLVNETTAAVGYLTAIWDALGVVKKDGHTSASRVALTWNLFNTNVSDTDYGLCSTLAPWVPTARGVIVPTIIKLTAGMEFESLDPKGTGVYVLAKSDKSSRLWVWQNRQYWSSIVGTTFSITSGLAGFTTLETHIWSGLYSTVSLKANQETITISNLQSDQTYMFLAHK